MLNIESIIKLKIFANGTSLPIIENYSMVVVDKNDYFEIGIINLDNSLDLVEIFVICNLEVVNKKVSEFLLKTLPRQNERETIYFLKDDLIKIIFESFTFLILPSSIMNYEREIILIDCGMLEYGTIKENFFTNKSDFKNYIFIKSFFYNVIEAYQGELLEKCSQTILEVPEKLNSIIKSQLRKELP